MKKGLVFLLFVFTFFNCSLSKNVEKQRGSLKYKIVEIPIVDENKSDTIYLNELRFFKIQSALDATGLMYQSYGMWSRQVEGKYQDNIKRRIWENIKLFDDSDEVFTVVVDGAETINDYYSCLMVFDSRGNDGFNNNHFFSKELIGLFRRKMDEIDRSKIKYENLH